MSTKKGKIRHHKFHGDPNRFQVLADFYDLIVGIHPDEALKDVVFSATVRPVIIIPCCNFWSKEETLGRDVLLDKIEEYYNQKGIKFKRVTFDFQGPKNIGLVSEPPLKT